MIFKLKSLKFTAIYEFINLDFMKSDEILSEINDIKFSNVIIGQNINFEKDIAYKNIKYLYFYDCIIEDEDIFEQIQNKKINNNLYIFSDNTKFTPKKYMNIKIFTIEQEELAKSDKILNYINPFDFIIEINNEKKYDLIQKVNLENIRSLDFSNAGISNLDFLTNNTLVNLEKLYLNNNNIEDISIFDDDKIHFSKLYFLNLQDNPIKKGLEALKKNFFQKCISVELDLSLTVLKVFIQFKFPNYNLNIFVNNFNEIANIFQKDKVVFGYISSEVADKFKEIFCLTNEEYEKKRYKPKEVIEQDYDDDYIKPNIIIDNGTSYCKAGLEGEEGPRAIFPSCVGYPKYASGMIGGDKKEFFVGDEAVYKRGVLKLNYPIEHGQIINWDNMEKIWGNIFTYELRVDPVEHNVMLTEPPKNPKENREKMAQTCLKHLMYLDYILQIKLY